MGPLLALRSGLARVAAGEAEQDSRVELARCFAVGVDQDRQGAALRAVDPQRGGKAAGSPVVPPDPPGSDDPAQPNLAALVHSQLRRLGHPNCGTQRRLGRREAGPEVAGKVTDGRLDTARTRQREIPGRDRPKFE